MTSLDIFQYAGQQVRTVIVNGEPWFVAKDACDVLGISKYRDAVAQLDADERASAAVDTLGGSQTMTIVNEPGIYALMLISRSPQVRDFQRWLTHEVIPSIRRTGQFGSQLPASFADALELAASKVREIEVLEAKAIADAPKVAAYDALMDSDGTYPMGAVANIGQIGRSTLYKRLRQAGVIQAGSQRPYQKYMHWFRVTTHPIETNHGNHISYTPSVLPDALTKVLAKAGVDVAETVAS